MRRPESPPTTTCARAGWRLLKRYSQLPVELKLSTVNRPVVALYGVRYLINEEGVWTQISGLSFWTLSSGERRMYVAIAKSGLDIFVFRTTHFRGYVRIGRFLNKKWLCELMIVLAQKQYPEGK